MRLGHSEAETSVASLCVRLGHGEAEASIISLGGVLVLPRMSGSVRLKHLLPPSVEWLGEAEASIPDPPSVEWLGEAGASLASL